MIKINNNAEEKFEKAVEKTKRNLLPLNLQFFAEGDHDGGEGGNDDPPGDGGQGDNDPPNDDPPSGGDGDHDGDGDGQKGNSNTKGNDKTLTQEQVNKLITKESRKAQEKLLKQLGVDDIKSAKDGLKQFQEMQDAQKTEAQKAKERAETLEQENSTYKNKVEDYEAQLAAMKAGVQPESVDDVVVLAKNLVDEDTDMDEAIQKVTEKYPHFKRQQEQQDEDDKKKKKPKFSEGDHDTSKGQPSEKDKWLNAFKF